MDVAAPLGVLNCFILSLLPKRGCQYAALKLSSSTALQFRSESHPFMKPVDSFCLLLVSGIELRQAGFNHRSHRPPFNDRFHVQPVVQCSPVLVPSRCSQTPEAGTSSHCRRTDTAAEADEGLSAAVSASRAVASRRRPCMTALSVRQSPTADSVKTRAAGFAASPSRGVASRTGGRGDGSSLMPSRTLWLQGPQGQVLAEIENAPGEEKPGRKA